MSLKVEQVVYLFEVTTQKLNEIDIRKKVYLLPRTIGMAFFEHGTMTFFNNYI